MQTFHIRKEGAHSVCRDRNWLEFLAVLDSTFAEVSNSSEPSDDVRAKCTDSVTSTREQFRKLADGDETTSRERGPLLAQLELDKRARHYGVNVGGSELCCIH